MLVDDVDEYFTAGDVQPLESHVVKQIIRVPVDGEVCDGFAAGGVQGDEPSWFAATDKQSMVRLIQRHWEVGLKLCHWPSANDRLLLAVDEGDLLRLGQVHENSIAVFLQLKRFGVRLEFDPADMLHRREIDERERTFAVTDIN